jgi:hypothetical protein
MRLVTPSRSPLHTREGRWFETTRAHGLVKRFEPLALPHSGRKVAEEVIAALGD